MVPGLRSFTSSQFFVPKLSIVRSRLFTTSLRLCATTQAKATPQPAAKPLPRSPSTPTSIPRTRYGSIKTLGSKTTPTVLYEGPSHFGYYTGCWTTGLFLMGWIALTAPSVIYQPEGVAQWIGGVYSVVYGLLGAMSFYTLAKTANIVRSIRVLPSQMASKPGAIPSSSPEPQLEVTVKRMLPMLKPKVVMADLSNVSLKSRFALPSQYVPQLRRVGMEQAEKARKEALRKFDMEHLLTMPFRRIARVFISIFRGTKAAWTDSGFGTIRVNGKSYKVDVTQGYAHDGFKTLERLVPVDSGKKA